MLGPQSRPVKARSGTVKAAALGNPASKTGSECSFTIRKLRFLACFFLVFPSLATLSQRLKATCVTVAPCVQSRTLNFLGSTCLTQLQQAFQPNAAMPANTSSYKELGEQDYRRNTMSYAVIVTGGKQYKVAPGEYLKIEKLEIATGESVTFDRVLLVANGDDVNIGAPVVAGATVVAEVISQGRHDKVRIIKFRRRKHHMKRMGHRQWYTEIKITGIQA